MDIVLKTATAHNAERVVQINVRAGQLRGIVPEQLKFCFGFMAEDTIAKDADLVINTLPIKARCKKCGETFLVREYRFACPECESDKVEVVQGMELMVENIEIADGRDPDP